MTELATEVCNDIRDINKNQWDNLVQQAVGGSVFTTYDWILAYERATDCSPHHVIVKKGDNPVGILPGYLVSIGGSPLQKLKAGGNGHAAPLVVGDEERVLSFVQRTIDDICGGRTVLHSFKPASLEHLRYGREFQAAGYRADMSNCRMQIDLTKEWTTILDGMDSSKRKTIEGLDPDKEVQLNDLDRENLDGFYDRYRRNMDRHEGGGLDKKFVSNLVDADSITLKLATARYDERIIGQYLYLVDDIQGVIRHFMSAVDPADFEHNPGELLHSHCIQWGCDLPYEVYDFGGTAADWRDGVFKYKSEFGGDLVPSVTWQRGYPKPVQPVYEWVKSSLSTQ